MLLLLLVVVLLLLLVVVLVGDQRAGWRIEGRNIDCCFLRGFDHEMCVDRP